MCAAIGVRDWPARVLRGRRAFPWKARRGEGVDSRDGRVGDVGRVDGAVDADGGADAPARRLDAVGDGRQEGGAGAGADQEDLVRAPKGVLDRSAERVLVRPPTLAEENGRHVPLALQRLREAREERRIRRVAARAGGEDREDRPSMARARRAAAVAPRQRHRRRVRRPPAGAAPLRVDALVFVQGHQRALLVGWVRAQHRVDDTSLRPASNPWPAILVSPAHLRQLLDELHHPRVQIRGLAETRVVETLQSSPHAIRDLPLATPNAVQ